MNETTTTTPTEETYYKVRVRLSSGEVVAEYVRAATANEAVNEAIDLYPTYRSIASVSIA